MSVNLQPHPLTQCNDQIYQSMRQSNGSNFFLNRRDRIVINGYLSKKSIRLLQHIIRSTKDMMFLFLRVCLFVHRITKKVDKFDEIFLHRWDV